MTGTITFLGPKGGQHSVRRTLRTIDLADGTTQVEIPLEDIPVRATRAVISFDTTPRLVFRPAREYGEAAD